MPRPNFFFCFIKFAKTRGDFISIILSVLSDNVLFRVLTIHASSSELGYIEQMQTKGETIHMTLKKNLFWLWLRYMIILAMLHEGLKLYHRKQCDIWLQLTFFFLPWYLRSMHRDPCNIDSFSWLGNFMQETNWISVKDNSFFCCGCAQQLGCGSARWWSMDVFLPINKSFNALLSIKDAHTSLFDLELKSNTIILRECFLKKTSVCRFKKHGWLWLCVHDQLFYSCCCSLSSATTVSFLHFNHSLPCLMMKSALLGRIL